MITRKSCWLPVVGRFRDFSNMKMKHFIQDVINGIGGIQVLFPLLEQVNKGPLPDRDILQQMDLVSSMSPPPEQEDWVVVPSSSYSGTQNICF